MHPSPIRGIAPIAALVAVFAATSVAYSAVSSTSSKPAALYANTQAAAGEKAYGANCAQCHGAQLEGGAGPALSGSTLATLAKNTHLTIGDMFTFMTQQMPMNAPATLPHNTYVSIMAFILKQNGYKAGSKPLTYAAATNSKVIIAPQKK